MKLVGPELNVPEFQADQRQQMTPLTVIRQDSWSGNTNPSQRKTRRGALGQQCKQKPKPKEPKRDQRKINHLDLCVGYLCSSSAVGQWAAAGQRW